jgi:hypothetical protein
VAAKSAHQPLIDISSLPDISIEHMDFHDTSFFQSNGPSLPQLPTPEIILQQHPDLSDGIVKFEHLNLVVKVGYSDYLRLEEAQTMRALRQAFPDNEVPVPEVFGWRTSGDQVFIYMSLIHGKTLREAWPSLTDVDKKSICDELRQIVFALRRITQGSSDRFIGKEALVSSPRCTKSTLPYFLY